MTSLHRLLLMTSPNLNQRTCVASGASGVSAALLVVVVWRQVNTAFLMESNAESNVLMETETKNNESATMTYLAQSIAKGVGVSTLLVLPLVAVDFSLACSPSPKKPCMVARLARSHVAPWRTIPAAQSSARIIARVIGRTGASALVQREHGVVQTAPRTAALLSPRTTQRADADAPQRSGASRQKRMLMNQQWTLEPVNSLAAQRLARVTGVHMVNAQERM